MTTKAIHPATRIGHMHLKVADLERALGFYRDVLGLEVTQRFGASAAFLSAGGYHHHIGLNTRESAGGRPPAAGTTGLYHLAILYPTRSELGDALRRLQKASIPLEGASDHGVSEALICATRMTTAWNCIGIGRRRNGRALRTAAWGCLRVHWIWSRCCGPDAKSFPSRAPPCPVQVICGGGSTAEDSKHDEH